ncbi:helix-turn-helix domain-containing protein [Embleya hyalina]|uniref:helix-turn-helix domain-containing protein n=1 Tax=Embleya hyalina TaxID=516124 RepID=UPI000F83D02C|nr:helix-turn-helix domain-containing protein [Embleya hyalina]
MRGRPDPVGADRGASWEGPCVPEVAARTGCHAKTVRRWLRRFDEGPGGLGHPVLLGRFTPLGVPRVVNAHRNLVVPCHRCLRRRPLDRVGAFLPGSPGGGPGDVGSGPTRGHINRVE